MTNDNILYILVYAVYNTHFKFQFSEEFFLEKDEKSSLQRIYNLQTYSILVVE